MQEAHASSKWKMFSMEQGLCRQAIPGNLHAARRVVD